MAKENNVYHIGKPFAAIDDDVMRPIEAFPTKLWWGAFSLSALAALIGVATIIYSFVVGLGVFAINNPVGWGFFIVNFVFWVGIGHAGTLISAILFLFRQKWRTSIARAAEAMTIFAVFVGIEFVKRVAALRHRWRVGRLGIGGRR